MSYLPPTFANISKAPLRLFFLITLFFSIITAGVAAEETSHSGVHGFVDALVLKDERITAQGWVGASQ